MHNTGDAVDGQNSKIIPPIWWCDPDTCEPEWDRVKYFITYITPVFSMWFTFKKYEKTMSEMYLFIDLLSNTCEIWWMICILYRWWSHKIIPSNIETTHLTATLIKYMLYCRNTLGKTYLHRYYTSTVFYDFVPGVQQRP